MIGAEADQKQRFAVARGEVALSPGDLGAALLFLCHDHDDDVRQAARQHLVSLTEEQLFQLLDFPDIHPQLLDLIVRCHYRKPKVVERLRSHPLLSVASAALLFMKTGESSTLKMASASSNNSVTTEAEASDDSDEPVDESPDMHNKYQLAQTLGVGEKIKYALTGDKEWRSIFIKDSNKQVSGAVIKNPRITESEVLTISKSALQNDEIFRVICHNKEWLKNYQIRKALVENSRTPLPAALRFLSTLTEKDLASLAKSKNVSTAISTQARRLISQKKRD